MRFFRLPWNVARAAPATRRGERIYAIGDIHGRLDLLCELLERIAAHDTGLPEPRSRRLILLGDLIDRGPDSAGVIRFARAAQAAGDPLTVLRGNHEEMMLRAAEGDTRVLRPWLRYGGVETLQSFGAPAPSPDGDIHRFVPDIPADCLDWLRALPFSTRSGDYFFCHAGVRPGVKLDRQEADDLLWIRDDFLDDDGDHGAVVVHGHTIAEAPDFRANRIGIDTGAYRTGILTALYLEDSARATLSTG